MIRLFKCISVNLCDSWRIRSHQTGIEIQSVRLILYFKELLTVKTMILRAPREGHHAGLILPIFCAMGGHLGRMLHHDPHLSNSIINPERAKFLEDRMLCRLGDVARRLSWIA
jgi:hypothetical protein